MFHVERSAEKILALRRDSPGKNAPTRRPRYFYGQSPIPSTRLTDLLSVFFAHEKHEFPPLRQFSQRPADETRMFAQGPGANKIKSSDLRDIFHAVGSSRVDLQACKLEYSIVSPK